MKDMDAMILSVVRQRLREGRRPPRDVVLAFLADEEAGGSYGARFLVDNHPGLFEGVTEAVGEVGGFSVTLGGQRLYLIQTAEKGMAWLRLTARGTAGHGSMLNPDNAVTELAETVARIGRHDWPVRLTPAVEAFLAEACTALGLEYGPEAYRQVIDKIGSLSRLTGATLRNTLNPTVLKAGYKVNVVPQVATADVDGRFLPGYEDEFFAEVDSLLGPGVAREFIHHDIALETTFDGDLCDAMTAALLAEDPGARVVPVLPIRRDRREVLQPARHAVLRLRPVAAPGGPGLLRHVPRRGRAGAGVRPPVRHARPGWLSRPLLRTALFAG